MVVNQKIWEVVWLMFWYDVIKVSSLSLALTHNPRPSGEAPWLVYE